MKRKCLSSCATSVLTEGLPEGDLGTHVGEGGGLGDAACEH